MRILLGVLLLSATAFADPELTLGASQLHLDPVRNYLATGALTSAGDGAPTLTGTAYASLDGGDTGPGLSAGAAVALGGLNCRLVDVSVQGHLHPRDEQTSTGAAQWDICLSRTALTVAFSGRRLVSVAPAIDARTSLWRRRYNETYDSFTIGIGDWGTRAHRHAVAQVVAGHGTTQQDDEDDSRTIVQLDVSFVGYQYRHAVGIPITVDAVLLTANAVKAGDSDLGAVTTAFEPVHATIDTGSLFASAAIGWGFSGGSLHESSTTMVDGQTTRSWSETIDNAGLPNLTRMVYDVTVGARYRAFELSATSARSLYPTFDGDLGLDARAAGRLAYTHGKTSLSLSPFVARSQTWRRDAPTQHAKSYGASISVGKDLSAIFRLDAIGQVARSPYARLDGDREPTNALGGQVLLALSAHVPRSH